MLFKEFEAYKLREKKWEFEIRADSELEMKFSQLWSYFTKK